MIEDIEGVLERNKVKLFAQPNTKRLVEKSMHEYGVQQSILFVKWLTNGKGAAYSLSGKKPYTYRELYDIFIYGHKDRRKNEKD